MAFEQTIAAAEEALEAEMPADTGYKNEMAIFVEQMSQLTEKVDKDAGNTSDNTSLSIGDTESNSETGSVIRHEDDGKFDTKLDSYSSDSGSVLKYDESEDRSRGGSTDASGGLSSSYDDFQNDPYETNRFRSIRRDSLEIHRENIVSDGEVANKEVSEIDIPVETVPPPLEFRNDPEDDEEERNEDEESEEEYRESVEEIVISLAPSSSYTFKGAYKIPDLETPKEHSSLPDSPRSRGVETSLSYTNFDFNDSQSHPDSRVEKTEETPREKEVYVLTREELNKISYVDESRWKSKPMSSSSYQHSQYYQSPDQVNSEYQSEAASAVSYASFRPMRTEEQEEIYYNVEVSSPDQDENVKTRCSEISFRPDSEGEIDNVLEEKSISMIALPAMRTSVLKKTDDEYLDSLKQDSYRSTASVDVDNTTGGERRMFFNDGGDHIVQAKKVYIDESADNRDVEEYQSSGHDAGEEDEDIKRQQAVLQSQYEMLQQQFSTWQQQLLDNQQLLASQQITPEVSNNQIQQMQKQMQMQQQMMTQLQESMQALALQQGTSPRAGVSSKDATSSASVAAAAAPPPPPPAPPAPVVKQVVRKEKPDRRNDPRFERKLDPREELMIAIRSFGGRNGLKTVEVQQTHWHSGP